MIRVWMKVMNLANMCVPICLFIKIEFVASYLNYVGK
jgi:hypothetical protein